MENPHLPLEILIEIFSMLPVKSVGKCRCLSKSWCSRLSTSQFINLHLTRKTHQENLILISYYNFLQTITHPIKLDSVPKKLELQNTWSEVVGSCNGLVLLLNCDCEMFLVNPITLQQVHIPDSTLGFEKYKSYRSHGFGYDCRSNDYKIVKLPYYGSNAHCTETFVDVYSLKWGVWRRVNCHPYDHDCGFFSGAFVNGAIHWSARRIGSGSPYVITAFYLTDEVFHEIPLPSNAVNDNFTLEGLTVLGGYLCMVESFSYIMANIWMMKQYGSVKSWTKLRIDVNDKWDLAKPLCFAGEHEVVLQTYLDSLVVYNTKEGTMEDMAVDGASVALVNGGTFVESLVPPNLHDISNQIEEIS